LCYKEIARSFVLTHRPERLPVSPADIPAAGLRAGLARRLAELGLIPAETVDSPVVALPAPAPQDERRAA
jgi:hypothetical protein